MRTVKEARRLGRPEQHLLTLALLHCGCTEQIEGRSDAIALFLPPSRPAPPELLEAVEEIYGMEIRLSEVGYGAIQVYLYDEGTSGALGEAAEGSWCSHSLWSIPEPLVLAHEIGHASGLEHVDAPEHNLMFVGGELESFDVERLENPGRATLEHWQLEAVQRANWKNEECRDAYGS